MRKKLWLGLCGVVLGATLAASAPEPPPSTKARYLVVYRPGPAWVAGKPVGEQPLKDHFKYMIDLHVAGALEMAGPFLDDTGGAMVVRVADDAEAKRLIAADPAVTGGVMLADVRPWRWVDWSQFVQKSGP